MFEFLKSRKVKVALTTAAGIISSAFAGAIDPTVAVYSVVALALGLIVSIAWEDVSMRGHIFDKAEELVGQADWLVAEAGELLTRVEEIAGEIESENE